MKNPSMFVLGILALFSAYAGLRRFCYWRCKKELEQRIKDSLYFPVEILSGPFRVLEKIEDQFLEVAPIGKPTERTITVKVPKRMWTRVSENVVYFFDYNPKEHEIRFDTNVLHTEASELPQKEVKRSDFVNKIRILKEILF